MKRNETILVYGVTGLLLVILLVAVMFGGDPGSTTKSATSKAVPLTDWLGDAPKPATSGDAAKPDANKPNEADKPKSESVPLSTPPRTLSIEMLGHSRRDGDYRVVTVQNGESFNALVQRWTGSLKTLPVVEALNETLDKAHLTAGKDIWLPWVEDEVLLEAHQARLTATPQPGAANSPAPAVTSGTPNATPNGGVTSQPPTAKLATDNAGANLRDVKKASDAAAAPAGDGTPYKVQNGDSLWSIAAQKVGAKQAPAYIDRVLALNKDVLKNKDKVRAGTTIHLPTN